MLSGCVVTKSRREDVFKGGGGKTSGKGGKTSGAGVGCLGLVDLTFWHCWFGGVGVCEAFKGVTVAGFDGIQPGLLDWEPKTGMVEPN